MPGVASEEASSSSGSSSGSSGQLLGESVRHRSSNFVRKARRSRRTTKAPVPAPSSPPTKPKKARDHDEDDTATQSPSSGTSSDHSVLLLTVSPMGSSLGSDDEGEPISDGKAPVASSARSDKTTLLCGAESEVSEAALAPSTASDAVTTTKPLVDGPSWNSPCSFPDLILPSLADETGTHCIGEENPSSASQVSKVPNYEPADESLEDVVQDPSSLQQPTVEEDVKGDTAEENSRSCEPNQADPEEHGKAYIGDQEKPSNKQLRFIPLGESVRPGSRRNRSKMRKHLSSDDGTAATSSELSSSSTGDYDFSPEQQCLPSRTPNIYDGDLYRDRSQALAVLSVAESKRQCWLQNEVQAGEREWDYYVSRLDKATQETQQIETYLANSNGALVEYSQAIEAICDGNFKAANLPGVGVEEFVDSTSTNPMFGTLQNCYAALKESLEMQLPEMTDSLREATLLKEEVGKKAAELEKRGQAIGWADTTRVEETIKGSFEALLSILMEQADPSAVEPRDRWLAEARYRNSARLGLDTWKATRNAYQSLYVDFWKLEDYRKAKQKKILGAFLPLRHSLMQTTHFAFDAGADVVGGEIKPRNLAKSFSVETRDTATSRSVWSSLYLDDCRAVRLKVGREWKPAVAVKTSDQRLHMYLPPAGSLSSNASLQELLEFAETEGAYVSLALSGYAISLDGSLVELERTDRSMIFRKRQDHLLVQLKDADEASKWLNHLNNESHKAEEFDF